MISFSQKVGRLAEIRMTAPLAIEDWTTLQRDMSAFNGKSPARLVVCADLSGASLFPDALAERLARFFRSDNQRLERVALVVGDSATLFLQVDRLLREGGTAPVSTPVPREPGTRDSREPPPSRSASGSDPMLSKRLPARRTFRATAEAITWLDEVLTAEERARVRSFLDPARPAK